MTSSLRFPRRLATSAAVLAALLTAAAAPAHATGSVSVWFGAEMQTIPGPYDQTYLRLNYSAFVTLDNPEQNIQDADVSVYCWGYDHLGKKVSVFQSDHTQNSQAFPLQVYTPGGGILLNGSVTGLKGGLFNVDRWGPDKLHCGAVYYGQPESGVGAPEVGMTGYF
ncbi:hypothetical protein [Kribbella sp. NPDC004536]|uniref:hypothetical protein n=1 Tax=Kribbella sp. NPDC004536 TaxID=3364106 RepID=UPI0036A614C3